MSMKHTFSHARWRTTKQRQGPSHTAKGCEGTMKAWAFFHIACGKRPGACTRTSPARLSLPSRPSSLRHCGFSRSEIRRRKTQCSFYIWVVVKIMVLFGTLNIRCRIILRTPRGTMILTTIHMRCSHVCTALLLVGSLSEKGLEDCLPCLLVQASGLTHATMALHRWGTMIQLVGRSSQLA